MKLPLASGICRVGPIILFVFIMMSQFTAFKNEFDLITLFEFFTH